MNEANSLKTAKTQALNIPVVMHCIYCGEPINEAVVYNEDAEPTHEQCLRDFIKHWEDRQETMDLMGY